MLSELSEIIPQERQLVMELVAAAGVDVSDWSNFKGGQRKAACNPKYCYEWSFVEPQKVVVINLWFESMLVQNGVITQFFNYRKKADELAGIPGEGLWRKRAFKLDCAIQEVARQGLPLRVIVCEGPRRGEGQPTTEASRVKKRLLDPVPWSISSYDFETGDCTLIRGDSNKDRYIDQFLIQDELEHQVERREVSGHVFLRNPEVRRRVLLRAGGRCEWCDQPGFLMEGGRVFLETHHVVPLSEAGADQERNVVALCPNHHREAHHGVNSKLMRAELLLKASSVRTAPKGSAIETRQM